MTNYYKKLVEALRCDAGSQYTSDAADAIEALQADMKTYGKTAFDEGYAMGLAAGEDRAEKQLPKQGECVLTKEEIKTIRIHMNAFKETLCNQHRYNEAQWYQDLVDKLAKMEAQDGQ